jgi:membrane associated rhomboid family serine protease
MPLPRWLTDLDRSVRRYVTPTVRMLIYINVLIFLITNLVFALFLQKYLDVFILLFSCNPWAFTRGMVWQFVTYMFLHGDVGHVFFNMLMLWFFGPVLEHRWGGRRFLWFYLICGVGAAVIYEVITLLVAGSQSSVMIGSSGAIYGVLFAFAFLYPDQPILYGFIIPIPARIFVAILILISFVGSLNQRGDNIAHLCHLAGMGVAWIYLMWPRWTSRGRGPRQVPYRHIYRG